MGNENNNIGYCLTNRESKQEILSKLSESMKHTKQIGHAFPERIISDIKFWLNENIDRFEKLPESEKVKLVDDISQLKLTISIVEQWFESQIGAKNNPENDVEGNSEINPTNSLTFKS